MCWAATDCLEFEPIGVADVRQPAHEHVARDAAVIILSACSPAVSEAWLCDQIAWLRASRPELPLVLLVADEKLDEADVLASRFDLQGYIPTSSPTAVAAAAIRLIVAGGQYLPRPRTGGIRPGSTLPPPPTPPQLPPPLAPMRGVEPEISLAKTEPRMTPREAAVLELLRRGLPNKLIAYRLGMSISTVKVHVHNIISKLNVHNRTEVAVAARDLVAEIAPVAPVSISVRPIPATRQSEVQ
jgi:DNA-binding NarL/FixJ family response regulator